MNSDELYTLKSMVLDNYEQYHDGLRILLESDKGLFKAFGQSPRTKYLKTENFYLTSKERLTYMMGFIDTTYSTIKLDTAAYGGINVAKPAFCSWLKILFLRGDSL